MQVRVHTPHTHHRQFKYIHFVVEGLIFEDKETVSLSITIHRNISIFLLQWPTHKIMSELFINKEINVIT